MLPRRSSAGFTIIELLISFGVILIALAILLPSLSGVRGRSFATVNISNIRQMGVGLSSYAASNRDLPPVFAPAVWPPSQRWDLGFGPIGTGAWFEHDWIYSFAITAELGSTAVANAGGRPSMHPIVQYRGEPASRSDFLLARSFYAAPAFFTTDRRTGHNQFAPQPFSSVVFPSSKGTLYQAQLFHHPDAVGATACCIFDLTSPVFFADHSVSEHILKRLSRGVSNPYALPPLPPGIDPDAIPGSPISDTRNGIAGSDLN